MIKETVRNMGRQEIQCVYNGNSSRRAWSEERIQNSLWGIRRARETRHNEWNLNCKVRGNVHLGWKTTYLQKWWIRVQLVPFAYKKSKSISVLLEHTQSCFRFPMAFFIWNNLPEKRKKSIAIFPHLPP